MVAPIPLLLHCPRCGTQHVDAPEEGWTNPPHRTHRCRQCECRWRPADVATVGVASIATHGREDDWWVGCPTLRDFAEDAYRKCMSAWSCGEPRHRVEAMIGAVEQLGSALAEPGRPPLTSKTHVAAPAARRKG
jgi:hypothetical protein